MSDGEIKTLEIDAVIFPIKFRRESEKQVSDETKVAAVNAEESAPNSVNHKPNAFARLKKSVRRKSISIL